MAPPLRLGVIGKGTLKLGAVVCQDLLDMPRKHGLDQFREARGVMAVVALHSDRQGEATGVIGGSEQVATGAPDRTRAGTDQPAVRAPIALARVLGNRTKLAYFSVQCRQPTTTLPLSVGVVGDRRMQE